MKRTHLAISILGIATAVGAATITCRVLILRFTPKPIVTHKLDHKPTAKTMAGWEAWDTARTLKELELACPPVDLDSVDASGLLLPMDVPEWEPVAVEPDVTVATLDVPEVGNMPIGYVLTQPFVPYGGYASPQPVPEPWSVVLVGVGMLAAFGIKKGRYEQLR